MKTSLTREAVVEAVLSLTAHLSMKARFEGFLQIFADVTGNHACTLLRYQEGVLIPVATRGLSPEVMGRRFHPDQHPRLAEMLMSRTPVRFRPDDSRPAPYDSLFLNDARTATSVHSSMGCGLYNENTPLGILSADALEPGAFDAFDDRLFQTFAAIATVALRYESFVGKLESLARHRGLVTNELVNEALERGGQMLGESPAQQELLRNIGIVAGSDLTVLVMGETGVGKEIVARLIHAKSPRAEQPLVYVNCAALPESLAESELFGHVRGAFTGAGADRAGKFELAEGGTLFLDEVGELPLSIQAKLLRALQFGEIQRLGSDRTHRSDVRIIAATNRKLADEVNAGRFRADLYHRLSVYPLNVAPLRERLEDVAPLAGHFLDQARVRLGLERISLSSSTIGALTAYSWPGNVRELEHVVLRAALRASSGRGRSLVLEPGDLDITPDLSKPAQSGLEPSAGMPLARAVEDFQRRMILDTLEKTQVNWAETARRLGLDPGNLHRLAKRLGIKPERAAGH